MTVLNVFILWKSRKGDLELVTPPSDGTILNGITRRAIVDLKDKILQEKGVKLIEKQVSIHEVISAHNEDRLIEFFGAATSSSIKPISTIVYKDLTIDGTKYTQNKFPFSNYINDTLIAIKKGSSEHPWITPLE